MQVQLAVQPCGPNCCLYGSWAKILLTFAAQVCGNIQQNNGAQGSELKTNPVIPQDQFLFTMG